MLQYEKPRGCGRIEEHHHQIAHGFLEEVMSDLRLDGQEGLDEGGMFKVWGTACVKVWKLHRTEGILRKLKVEGARVGKGRHRVSDDYIKGWMDGWMD